MKDNNYSDCTEFWLYLANKKSATKNPVVMSGGPVDISWTKVRRDHYYNSIYIF